MDSDNPNPGSSEHSDSLDSALTHFGRIYKDQNVDGMTPVIHATRNLLHFMKLNISNTQNAPQHIQIHPGIGRDKLGEVVLVYGDAVVNEPASPIVNARVGYLTEKDKFVALISRNVGTRINSAAIYPNPGQSIIGRMEFNVIDSQMKMDELRLRFPVTTSRQVQSYCAVSISPSGALSKVELADEAVQALEVRNLVSVNRGSYSLTPNEVREEGKQEALDLITQRCGFSPDIFSKPIDVAATMNQLLVSPDFSINSQGHLSPPIVHR